MTDNKFTVDLIGGMEIDGVNRVGVFLAATIPALRGIGALLGEKVRIIPADDTGRDATPEDELRGLLGKVTPGPWHVRMGKYVRVQKVDGKHPVVLAGIHKFGKLGGKTCDGDVAANAALIAMAPDLAAEVLRLRAERDALVARDAEAREVIADLKRRAEAAHESLFRQCLSNPIINAWGKEITLSEVNDLTNNGRAAAWLGGAK